MRTALKVAAIALGAPVTALFGLTAASAHTLPGGDSSATTHLINRDDSGAVANWAIDNIWRDGKLREMGIAPAGNCAGNAPCFEYSLSISDQGTFRTDPFALTPNQSGPFAGEHIKGIVNGQLQGFLQFGDFYSTAKPNTFDVPRTVFGDTPSTGVWPELFFPHTATLYQGDAPVAPGNITEPYWSWSYHAVVRTPYRVLKRVWLNHRFVWIWVTEYKTTVQHWVDASNNNGGDLPFDGNITG
jgi:hypothetical protein